MKESQDEIFEKIEALPFVTVWSKQDMDDGCWVHWKIRYKWKLENIGGFIEQTQFIWFWLLLLLFDKVISL
jgi:hypothetical protein